jgi:PKD repeat protein
VVYAWSVNGAQPFSPSADVRFTTRFDQAGTYNITLTITDQNGLSNSSSLQVEVTAPEAPQTPPTAVIEGPGEAVVGENVTFRGGNSAPGSSAITGYAWDFGNGQTGSGESASTVYTAPGTYQVTLTVTDENGLSNSSSLQVEVTAPEAPQTPPTAVIEGPGEAVADESVTFRGGNSTPGSSAITSYTWDFGNGQTGNGESASTVYTAPGTYQVSLTVTDENGLNSSASQQISIQAAEE